jgi:hypothetical protein
MGAAHAGSALAQGQAISGFAQSIPNALILNRTLGGGGGGGFSASDLSYLSQPGMQQVGYTPF